MKPLAFFTLFLLAGLNGFGQVAKTESVPLPGASPAFAGPHRTTSRFVSWDSQNNRWRADSLWRMQDVVDVNEFGSLVRKTYYQLQYSYSLGDTVFRTSIFYNRQNDLDTATYGQLWRSGHWEHNSYTRGTRSGNRVAYSLFLWRNNQWTVSGGKLRLADAQNRLVEKRDSTISTSFPGTNHEHFRYEGANTQPFRRDVYGQMWASPDSCSTCYAVGHIYTEDSMRYDALGRITYKVRMGYLSAVGPRVSIWRNWFRYNGDSTIQETDEYGWNRDTTHLAVHYRRKLVTIQYPDSMRYLNYQLYNGRGWVLVYKELTKYSLPSRYPRDLDFERIGNQADSNGVFYARSGSKSATVLNGQGIPIRTITYLYNAVANGFIPSSKTDYEFFARELLGTKDPASAPAGLMVSPNPAIATLTLNQEADRLILTNALGQQYILPVQNQKADPSSLLPGLYHVSAYYKSKLVGTARLVKE